MSGQTGEIPAHVPPHLVYDFDAFNAPELQRDPHRQALILHRAAPPIFYTPQNGGHWVVARAAEALEILRETGKFSSSPEFCTTLRKPWTLPNQSDPPAHTEYRRLVNGAFAPAAVNRMEDEIRALAVELIEAVRQDGQCEFVEDIAKRFPVTIFLRMVGAPVSDRAVLQPITDRAVRHPTREGRNEATAELAEYVRSTFAKRREAPGDDLFSRVLAGKFQGRALNDEELLGMGLLLLLGGLDTVAAMISFIMLHLARNPAQYAELVANRDMIPAAVEELMRVHGVASMQRGVTEDLEFRGVQFRKYDRLQMLPQIYGLDDHELPDPLAVRFDRAISPHLAFGAGPHRCVGSHLARVEIRVLLEEWTRRIPAYTIPGDYDGATSGGVVWIPLALPLSW